MKNGRYFKSGIPIKGPPQRPQQKSSTTDNQSTVTINSLNFNGSSEIATSKKQRRASESNKPISSNDEYGLLSKWNYIKQHKPNINSNVANNPTREQFRNFTKKITNLYMLSKENYNQRNSKPLTTNNTEFTLEKFARGIRQKVRHLTKYKINASNYTVNTIYEKIGNLLTSLDTVFINFKQIKGSINEKYHKNLEAMIKSVPINKVLVKYSNQNKYNINILLNKLTDKSITTDYDELREMVFSMIKQRSVKNGKNVVHDKNIFSKNAIKPNIDTLSKKLESLKQKLSNKIMVYKEFGEQLPVKLHEVLFQKIDTVINQVETIKRML